MTQNNLRLTFIAGAAAILFAGCSPTANTSDAPAAKAPASQMSENAAPVKPAAMKAKTKAVLIYADWCGSCKVLDPKVKAVKAAHTLNGLEFVTLDYTSKDPAKFYAQAKAAGVEKAVRAYLDGTVKTGQLLLVDMDDKKVIGKVTKEKSRPEIVAALKTAIAAS